MVFDTRRLSKKYFRIHETGRELDVHLINVYINCKPHSVRNKNPKGLNGHLIIRDSTMTYWYIFAYLQVHHSHHRIIGDSQLQRKTAL